VQYLVPVARTDFCGCYAPEPMSQEHCHCFCSRLHSVASYWYRHILSTYCF